MRKVIVDFVAHRSVVVALKEDQDEDYALEIAEKYVENTHYPTDWEFDNNIEDVDDSYDAINE